MMLLKNQNELYMITGKQVRAARGLLDWSASSLAERIGCQRVAIEKFERGETTPQKATLTDIARAFDDAGIEFLDNQGVRYKPEGMEVLQGPDGLIALMEDLYATCKNGKGGDVVLAGAPEDEFVRILGEYDETYIANMSSIKNFKMRTLIEEGDKNTVSSSYTEYRWSPKEIFHPVPFYAYGEKLAIVVFESDPSPQIYIIKSKTVADAYRLQFASMWELSSPVPKGKRQ